VVDCFGPADLTADLGKNNNPVMMQVFGTNDKNSQILSLASPVTYASSDDPPFLVLHGDKDPVVPLEQGKLMDQAMDKAGAVSDLVIVKNAGHGFIPTGGRIDPSRLEISRKIADFFDKYLKK
jgi:dipeptidyl aminopeptidase/acylaminoacyl peptidase